jgi:UDP-glucose-4-epimerase GalE
LRQNGYNPITFDNLVYGHKEHVLFGEFEFGDLNDAARLREVFKKYNPLAVIHFAAFTYVGESVTDPYKYYHNNVFGTLNLLNVMREFLVKNIVFSSTCAVYGVPESLPIVETTKTNPINPYGSSKLMVEKILQDFKNAYEINHVALRYFNACGASADAEIGESHDPETHLIPLAIYAALGKSDSITIYGEDYPTKDGTCIRDYIHVEDLADAHLKALEFLLKNKKSEIFNVGIGQGFSVKEVINAVKKISGKDFTIKHGTRREGDPSELIADNSKIKNILGWKPKYTEIEKMVATAYRWHSTK